MSHSEATTQQEMPADKERYSLPNLCPHLADFDPAMPRPQELLKGLRDEAPAFYSPRYSAWIVTRHEDLLKIFKDPISFSNSQTQNMRVPMPAAVAEEVGADYKFPFVDALNILDPPAHTRVRKLMQGAFTPRSVSVHEEHIKELVNQLVDRFVDDGRTDLVASYTSPLPINVIAMVLGMSQDDALNFKDWVDAFLALTGGVELPEEEAVRHWRNLIACERFTRSFIEKRRESPAEDLTSALILAKSDDGSPSLTDEQLLSQLLGFLAAGSDTTSTLLTKTAYYLLSDRRRWEEVAADPALIPQVLEEGLRLGSPVRGLYRVTTTEVELGGVRIPAGETIYYSMESANLDPSVFSDPERFELRRENVAEHLALGKWTHFCIGAPLARLEARIGLETLIERIPNLRLAPGQGELDFDYNVISPTLRGFEVEWS